MTIDTEAERVHALPESDVDDAIDAIRVVLMSPRLLMTLPPQFGANLPNIYRCLILLKAQFIASRKTKEPE